MDTLYRDAGMFREALALTRGTTGFAERLIEKDYFCTAVLEYLTTDDCGLVFKGGTCLAKIHANFYRLSEDLDFVIPVPTDSPRAQRRNKVRTLKEMAGMLSKRLPVFSVVEPLTGANNSTQYIMTLGYISLTDGRTETINIEVGLREPLLLPTEKGSAKTILLDPVCGKTLVAPVTISCIAKLEAFAEKFRAALSRREAAIRDFFDLDYAMRRMNLAATDTGLVDLVRRKLAVPGNGPVDISSERLKSLQRQVEPQLQAVLRPADFADFDLERAFQIVSDMARDVGKNP